METEYMFTYFTYVLAFAQARKEI